MSTPYPGKHVDMSEPTSDRRPVVVGVDGSEPSLTAADLAGEQAALRNRPLELIHAFVLPVTTRPFSMAADLPPVQPVDEVAESALRDHAEQVLHEAAARVRSHFPDLAMISRLRDGFPGEVLTEASRQAALVVVGHRGAGGFAELLTGSTSIQLANHSAAPVIITRGELNHTGPVVVGVDGSEGSRRAAEFAVETAALLRASLIALYAWPADAAWSPALAQAGQPPPTVPEDVTRILDDISQAHPKVPVHTEVRPGSRPAHSELVAASRNARLVVVGARGRGGFRGLLLGSVSQALIHHAECPVAVVGPATRADEAP